MTVVDASALIDLLVPPSATVRDALIAELPEPAMPWLAPDIVAFEVFAVLRRHAQRGVLSAPLAVAALDRFRRLPIETVATHDLLDDAWGLRERFGAGDALYAAVARRVAEPLLTTDRRFARAAQAAGLAVVIPAA
ncbi:type II toxin-antitoxin system VapC family toxin [Svornostia abyssi]|uniref:Ribonuclease VapC n=1 Tax=Svornostia abyssi TaxID=2898438 RepID=A0ABY5PN16_9ACTN|nr:type II toxin-antitoxin system VapC family toxin [Parviterribacteraceae bacterium J379]